MQNKFLTALLLFCLLGYNTLWAQKIDKGTYNSMVDYFSAEITKAYIEALPKKEDKNSYAKIKTKLDANKINNPIEHETLSTLLEANFKTTRDSITVKILKNKDAFKEDVSITEAVNQIVSLSKLSDKNKPDAVTSRADVLKTEIQAHLNTKFPKEEPTSPKPLDKVVPKVEPKPSLLGDFNFLLTMGVFISLVCFVCFVWYSLNQKNKLLEDNYSLLKKEIKQLIEKEKQNILLEVSTSNERKQNLFDSKKLKEVKVKEEDRTRVSDTPIRPTVFYLANPSDENKFHAGSFSIDSVPTISRFKFTYTNSSETEASFEFESDKHGINSCIIDRARTIDLVADVKTYKRDATKITTIKQGKAVKQGDYWIVTQKAEVIYE